jgi:phosphatidate phosphatase PAH1
MEEDRYGRKSRGGTALDVIVVLPASIRNGKNLLFDEGGIVSSSDFIVQLPARSARNSFFTADTAVCNVVSYSNDMVPSGAEDQDQRNQKDSLLAINHVAVFINNNYIPDLSMERNSFGNCTFTQGTLRPDPNVLKSLVVKQIITPGENKIRYVYYNSSISSKHVDARLFAWYSTDRLIISDIDGTVTKSDISGVVDSVIRESYTHVRKLHYSNFALW